MIQPKSATAADATKRTATQGAIAPAARDSGLVTFANVNR